MTSDLKAKAALSERGDDLYETPPVAVAALLKRETLPSVVWEPACGHWRHRQRRAGGRSYGHRHRPE